jgi:hypothetical protein
VELESPERPLVRAHIAFGKVDNPTTEYPSAHTIVDTVLTVLAIVHDL